MKTKLFTALAALLYITACSGGISDNTLISDMDEDDAEAACAQLAAAAPSRTVTCDFDGMEVTFDIGVNEAECVETFEPAPEGCTATFGDVVACMSASTTLSDEELCDPEGEMETPPECEALFSEECAMTEDEGGDTGM